MVPGCSVTHEVDLPFNTLIKQTSFTLPVYSSFDPANYPTMSEEKIDLGKIPILHGQTTYCAWSLEVQATAKMASFWNAYLGKNQTTLTDKAAQDKYAIQEQRAQGLIMKTISITLKEELANLAVKDPNSKTTPKAMKDKPSAEDLWVHLKKKFEKKDGISAILDLAKLCQVNFVNDGNIKAQLNKYQDTHNRCILQDMKFEDWQYTTFMTLHLPESYAQLKESIFNASSPKDLKSDKVRAKIIDTETHCKAEQTNSATNNMTKGKGNTKKKKLVKPTTVTSLDVTCFKCKKVGHILRNCHSKKKNDSAAGLLLMNRPGSSTNAGLNVVETEVDAKIESPIFCYFGAPENWLMDSGAIDHMSLSRTQELLTKIRTICVEICDIKRTSQKQYIKTPFKGQSRDSPQTTDRCYSNPPHKEEEQDKRPDCSHMASTSPSPSSPPTGSSCT